MKDILKRISWIEERDNEKYLSEYDNIIELVEEVESDAVLYRDLVFDSYCENELINSLKGLPSFIINNLNYEDAIQEIKEQYDSIEYDGATYYWRYNELSE